MHSCFSLIQQLARIAADQHCCSRGSSCGSNNADSQRFELWTPEKPLSSPYLENEEKASSSLGRQTKAASDCDEQSK
jgi:hypothetical protein